MREPKHEKVNGCRSFAQKDDTRLRRGLNNVGGPIEGGYERGQIYSTPKEEMPVPFGSGLVNVSNDGHGIGMEDDKRRLAKRANQIYRTLCDELALQQCFFYGFRAWSEFVDGKMNETKFYEAAKAEAQDVVAKSR